MFTIYSSVADWMQSIEGVMTMTFGGMSLSAIIINVWATIKNVAKAKNAAEIMVALGDAKSLIDTLTKDNKVKDDQLVVANAEAIVRQQRQEAVESFTMKMLSVIIAQSNGIDPIAKIALLNEAKELKTNVIDEGKKLLEKIKNDALEAAKVIAEETKNEAVSVGEETLGQAMSILDGYINQK